MGGFPEPRTSVVKSAVPIGTDLEVRIFESSSSRSPVGIVVEGVPSQRTDLPLRIDYHPPTFGRTLKFSPNGGRSLKLRLATFLVVLLGADALE